MQSHSVHCRYCVCASAHVRHSMHSEALHTHTVLACRVQFERGSKSSEDRRNMELCRVEGDEVCSGPSGKLLRL